MRIYLFANIYTLIIYIHIYIYIYQQGENYFMLQIAKNEVEGDMHKKLGVDVHYKSKVVHICVHVYI